MTAGDASPQPLGVVWHMDRLEQPATPAPKLPARFGRVGPAAVAELAQAMGRAEPALVQHRLDAGRRCYAAWTQGCLAAYGWVSFAEESVGELGLRLRLLSDEAYVWDCATLPDYRRQGLYAALLGYITQALRAEGVSGFWIGADAGNEPSQAGFARAGFTAVGDLLAAPPQPGERRRRAWLEARPGISPERLAEARRAYLDESADVWLFE
jgi:GNAT superfamily N-acetyltransferase